MYGDKQFTNMNTGNKFKGDTKVYRYKAHERTCSHDFIVGYAGTANDIVTINSWYSYPDLFDNPPRPPRQITGLVLCSDGDIYTFTDYMKWLKVDQPFHAIGSGMDYAIGAMAAGMSAKEAVKLAMKHDCYTGMGIKGFSID